MNIENHIKTKDGYKEKIGNHWYYFVETRCENCGITVFKSKKGLVTNKYKPFCGMVCKCEYEQKIRDPKGFAILDHKDTSNFSYLLGLIATDGHIDYPRENSSSTNSACIIELKGHDKDLLIKLTDIFGGCIYDTFTNRKDKTSMCKWYLNNRNFIAYLRGIGFIHNKTHTLDLTEWFNGITEMNKWHFIRGVWDGDGTITIDKNGKCRISFISASENFADMIYNFLVSRGLNACKCIRKNIKYNSSYYIISLSRKSGRISFIDKLYGDIQNGIYLIRKYNKALDMKMQGG